jgi:hypothetical protein
VSRVEDPWLGLQTFVARRSTAGLLIAPVVAAHQPLERRRLEGSRGAGWRAAGAGFRVHGFGFRVKGSEFRVQEIEFWIRGLRVVLEYEITGLGFRI